VRLVAAKGLDGYQDGYHIDTYGRWNFYRRVTFYVWLCELRSGRRTAVPLDPPKVSATKGNQRSFSLDFTHLFTKQGYPLPPPAALLPPPCIPIYQLTDTMSFVPFGRQPAAIKLALAQLRMSKPYPSRVLTSTSSSISPSSPSGPTLRSAASSSSLKSLPRFDTHTFGTSRISPNYDKHHLHSLAFNFLISHPLGTRWPGRVPTRGLFHQAVSSLPTYCIHHDPVGRTVRAFRWRWRWRWNNMIERAITLRKSILHDLDYSY
jgi:hypothetical protein